MSGAIGRTVLVLRMQTNSHLEGHGNLGPVVDKNSAKQGRPLVMTVVEGGVTVKSGPTECFIPFGNIISAQLAPESK